MPVYVVSACLAGCPCRYDGGSNPCPAVIELVRRGEALPLCPEELAELPVPRPPCELQRPCQGAEHTPCLSLEPGQTQSLSLSASQSRTVLSKDGQDMSAAFARGARLALEAALAHGCTRAILKSRSPSCGISGVYDGTFSKTLTPGMGLWAQLLAEQGVELFSEENFK